MSPSKARWMLAVAVAKAMEGARLLRVYDKVLDKENRAKILKTQENFARVAQSTAERLYRETLA